MIVPIFRGTTRDGKLTVANRAAFEAHLRKLAGKDIEIIVRIPDKARSLRQNAFFHSVIIPMMAEAAGYTPEEMKISLKKHYKIPHTSKLTTREFSRFVENCIQLAAETYEIVIPDPKDVEF